MGFEGDFVFVRRSNNPESCLLKAETKAARTGEEIHRGRSPTRPNPALDGRMIILIWRASEGLQPYPISPDDRQSQRIVGPTA